MDWKIWEGKNVFVKLKTGAVYSGRVIDVESSDGILFFISMRDKFGELVWFVHSEVVKIKEEDGEKDKSVHS